MISTQTSKNPKKAKKVLLKKMTTLIPQVIKTRVFLKCQQVRWLPRWSHRRPTKILAANDYDSINDAPILPKEDSVQPDDDIPQRKHFFNSKIKWKQPDTIEKKIPYKQQAEKQKLTHKPLTLVSKSATKKDSSVDMFETILDNEGNLVYTKLANNDLRISKIMTEIKSKREKDKRDLMLLEGKRLICEALQAGCKLEYILFSRIKELDYIKPFLPKIGGKLYKIPYREMQIWSDLTTNPGIMGVFKIPDLEQINPQDPIPLTVICDNIREPNNLGSILRICCGVGCKKVILTKGCVNVWDSKVLRSSSGAHFHLKVVRKLDWDDIRKHIDQNSTVLVADNSTIASQNESMDSLKQLVESVPVLPYFDVDFQNTTNNVLIIGGETEGISEESYKLAHEFRGVRLNIPLNNNLNSLNTGTALAVLVFEIKKQLSRAHTNRVEVKNI